MPYTLQHEAAERKSVTYVSETPLLPREPLDTCTLISNAKCIICPRLPCGISSSAVVAKTLSHAVRVWLTPFWLGSLRRIAPKRRREKYSISTSQRLGSYFRRRARRLVQRTPRMIRCCIQHHSIPCALRHVAAQIGAISYTRTGRIRI